MLDLLEKTKIPQIFKFISTKNNNKKKIELIYKIIWPRINNYYFRKFKKREEFRENKDKILFFFRII
jgi:hypothetical protein